MNDDPIADQITDEDTVEDDNSDAHDDAVIAADATGMLAGERMITEAEIDEGLGDASAGDV